MSETPATFTPALILHGGAGNIQRAKLPPDLYAKHHASLQSYLRSTHTLLKEGASALDAAVHAVSLMEDDELFNCGRGSVFTTAGTIEMEASIMVTTVQGPDPNRPGEMKKAAAVMNVRNVRHPILLARESLLRTGYYPDGKPKHDGGSMHPQLAGPHVETLAREWGLEFKPDEWFWTQRRWDEHRRGLEGKEQPISLSQGTVGCVCLDQWGNLAVATSTGGKTNKLPGRIGDTPTLGAGFWADAWDASSPGHLISPEDMGSDGKADVADHSASCIRDRPTGTTPSQLDFWASLRDSLRSCLAPRPKFRNPDPPAYSSRPSSKHAIMIGEQPEEPFHVQHSCRKLVHSGATSPRKAIAISGTGDGDAFLRLAAAHSVASLSRLQNLSLGQAVTSVAGLQGTLQQSAGPRWGVTGEGEGGFIGIEIDTPCAICSTGKLDKLHRGNVVFDFNCGGMWRAWIESGPDGEDVEKVMVFREDYE
ncbi:putative isoaspartyl peptidase/L-asparaginase [Penicillium rolfsii]|nr:putative isoaspartyl peptidase/L-asparaginase [Penicillium rolfsii]